MTLERVILEHHEPLLTDWLRRPHVTRWWGDTASRIARLHATPEHQHAIIAVGGAPVGYLRWQTVERAALAAVGLTEIPDGAVDIDIFIGEARWLGRGVGSTALRLLLAEHLVHDGSAPLAGLCTSVENAVAVRAFEKAGFRKLRQFDDPTSGRCWVLVTDLPGKRGCAVPDQGRPSSAGGTPRARCEGLHGLGVGAGWATADTAYSVRSAPRFRQRASLA